MPFYTVGQAARLTGKSKPTITRAIKAGALSATRNDDGSYSIDAAELSRVFGLSADGGVTPASNESRNMTRSETPEVPPVLQRENALLREMLAERDGVIADLRTRLDEERTDRRQTADRLAAAQERITALLTDQRAPSAASSVPAKRRWWWRGWRPARHLKHCSHVRGRHVRGCNLSLTSPHHRPALKVQNMLVCWRDVAAAWALVLALILAVFGTVDFAPSIDRAEASPVPRSVRVPLRMDYPRHEPFNHGLRAFNNDPAAAQGDD